MWLVDEEKYNGGIERMPAVAVSAQDIREATRYTRNWAALGPDFVHNFWYKKFSTDHGRIADCFNRVLRDPQELPEFITKGVTFLLPKDPNTADPAKYRPITSLSSLYKVLSSVITRKIQDHCDANQVMTEEQKGCRKNTQGCREQVIIDAVIVSQASRKQKNLGMAYIDYKKAYNSVPHPYLIKVLELYKIDDGVIRFMQHAMRRWNTSLHVTDGATVLRSRTLNIRRGIFQGDTLSPLWFCLAPNPLSRALNRCSYGYQLKSGTTSTTVTHTFYMDDLKLFAETKEKLQLILLVSTFSNDICMKFGIDKCRLVNLHRGKVVDADSFRINEREEIRCMVEGESYKYLGFLQLKGIHHTVIKRAAGFRVVKWTKTDFRLQIERYECRSPNTVRTIQNQQPNRTVCRADHGFSDLHLAQEKYQLNCDLKTVEEKVASWKQKYILHESIEDRCRKCNLVGESIEHVVAGCQALNEIAYLGRHNTVAKIVHQQLALKHDLVNQYLPCYNYLPDPVLENSCIKLYWNREIITDVLIHANRHDIVVYDKRMKRVTIIDIAVPLDRNFQSTFSTNITKYHNLAEELKQMWQLEEVRIVPVIISATEIFPCTQLRSLDELELRRELPNIQKAVILGTCNTVQRFLNHHN
ncbi:uncharacterized protein LOC129728715 [Wyeomyia smithii]|uniref:uncharacterized protein LOC129728715 n=1 Tax=Wyeomyia smithii TaxID=174621 RepID=UPI002467C293|nr:uncharacterized protein LOC129728715 [Wyeomyia smithii]